MVIITYKRLDLNRNVGVQSVFGDLTVDYGDLKTKTMKIDVIGAVLIQKS